MGTFKFKCYLGILEQTQGGSPNSDCLHKSTNVTLAYGEKSAHLPQVGIRKAGWNKK